MGELTFQVLIDPSLPSVIADAVSFETGASRSEIGPRVYNHHGSEFQSSDPGALTLFHEDLISGLALPLTFATHGIAVDTVVAAALFMHRDLAVHPDTPGLVASLDLAHRYGPAFYAHMETNLASFFRAVEQFFPVTLPHAERGERFGTAIQWVRDFVLDARLPSIGRPGAAPTILDVGTNGFVLALGESSVDAWIDLFRRGFLRGVLLGPGEGDFRSVLIARKSPKVGFDLDLAAQHLNELEGLSGGSSPWVREGDFLRSPIEGSAILVEHLMEVCLRV